MVILTDGFPVSHSTMNNAFAAAFFKMGLLGQAHNNNVSNIWCFVKFYPRHLPRLAQLIDCSFVIPSPPSLNDIIQFPPGQFLADVQQSVSSPSRGSFIALATTHKWPSVLKWHSRTSPLHRVSFFFKNGYRVYVLIEFLPRPTSQCLANVCWIQHCSYYYFFWHFPISPQGD